ncbi:MAG: hypothetical protein WCJ19_00285 [bacterium]
MILKVFIIILFLLWGFVDKSMDLQLFGYSLFIGQFVYLSLLLILRNKDFYSICGFFYFLSLGSSLNIIGFLPLMMLILESIFFLAITFLYSKNRTIYFIICLVFFILNYFLTIYLMSDYRMNLSYNIFIVLILVGLVGGAISIFSHKPNER